MSDYMKKLFIDEAKAVLFKGSIAGGGTVDDDNVATDEEVGDVVDDVFGSETGDTGSDTGTDTTDDNVATDEEVDGVIDDVFG